MPYWQLDQPDADGVLGRIVAKVCGEMGLVVAGEVHGLGYMSRTTVSAPINHHYKEAYGRDGLPGFENYNLQMTKHNGVQKQGILFINTRILHA